MTGKKTGEQSLQEQQLVAAIPLASKLAIFINITKTMRHAKQNAIKYVLVSDVFGIGPANTAIGIFDINPF